MAGHGYVEIGRHTLVSSADELNVPNLPAFKYLKIEFITIATGGTTNNRVRFNDDSGNNYATQYSRNFTGTPTNETSNGAGIVGSSTDAYHRWAVYELVNIATVEKIINGIIIEHVANGAGNPPDSWRIDGKWANTADLIDEVTLENTSGTGSFAAGSELIIYGKN